MSDLLKRAREDLRTVSAEAWVEIYGERLLDEADRTAAVCATANEVVARFIRAAWSLRKGLDSFKKATGWSPGARPGRSRAAFALAEAVSSAQREILSGKPQPKRTGDLRASLARRLEESLGDIRRRVAATGVASNPDVARKLSEFERGTERMVDKVLGVDRHPAGKELRDAGTTVGELVRKIGPCSSTHGCRLWDGHPGDCPIASE